jgi:hypothetical protein
LIEILDISVLKRLEDISKLAVIPNRFWYSKVELTETFLFDSLLALRSAAIGLKKGAMASSDKKWIKLAISGFLKGLVKIDLTLGAQPADDSVNKVAMPSVVSKNGNIELVISAAAAENPFDGDTPNGKNIFGGFEKQPNVNRQNPAHPLNGAIPALHVYRSLRGKMIDAAPGSPVPDAMLPPEPQYFPVRFTRIWKPEKDCSVHFPSQQRGARSACRNRAGG